MSDLLYFVLAWACWDFFWIGTNNTSGSTDTIISHGFLHYRLAHSDKSLRTLNETNDNNNNNTYKPMYDVKMILLLFVERRTDYSVESLHFNLL